MTFDHETDLTDAEAEAILAESPDVTLVTDFLAGTLDDRAQVAFRERLRLDAGFRAVAAPLMDAWESVPTFRPRMTEVELQDGWQRFKDFAGIADRPRRSGRGQLRQRRSYRLALAGMGMLLLVGLPLAGWIGYSVVPRVREPMIHAVTADGANETVAIGRTSSVVLTAGAFLYWADRPDAAGRQDLTLVNGNGMFVLGPVPNAVWVVRTPSGRLSLTDGVVQVDVRDPQLTFVRVDKGQVTLDATGAPSAAPLVVGPGDRGLLVHGQPPARANR